MRRRFLIVAGGGLLALAGEALSQASAPVPCVGFLLTHGPVDDPVVQTLRDGLQRFGYVDGRNLRLEVRSAMGQIERVRGLVAELLTLPVQVLLVVNEVSLRAAMQATTTTPIVMTGWASDPVAAGVVASYRHPGGNVTGVYSMPSSLSGKRLEIVKEVLPSASRVAVLYDTFGRPQLPELRQAARALGIRLLEVAYPNAEGLDDAFKAASNGKASAVLLPWSPVLYVQRARVARLALGASLPTVTEFDVVARAGCLLSYGFSVSDAFARAAYLISRVLTGAKPADLPVEQITTARLVVNLQAAQKLGIRVPESILLRADEVIQ